MIIPELKFNIIFEAVIAVKLIGLFKDKHGKGQKLFEFQIFLQTYFKSFDKLKR